ncbi:MAG: tripartite tricarboxylate transporter substrate binding protein [Desulfobacterales bacterium]|nr:tripartite tricarboxylate transporter substrate binding protein [Desulfobacterales bacterium]
MKTPYLRRAVLKLSVLALMGISGAHAQDAWPNKPIRIIGLGSPGTLSDTIGRIIGDGISKRLGVPVIIEHKPGAAGQVGVAYGAKAPPDGYTITMGTAAPLGVAPSLSSKLPYDYTKDIVGIALVAQVPLVLIVAKDSPFRTMSDLIAYAQANPGKLNFGSSGAGSTSHLATVLLATNRKLQMASIPYSSAGSAVLPVISKQVDFALELVSAVSGQIQQGGVRALAIAAPARSSSIPNVPTMAEAGVPDFEVGSWTGLIAPAGTPRPIIEKLAAAVLDSLKDPEIIQRFNRAGAEVAPLGPREFERFYFDEVKRWAPIVKASGAKID